MCGCRLGLRGWGAGGRTGLSSGMLLRRGSGSGGVSGGRGEVGGSRGGVSVNVRLERSRPFC